MYVLVLQVMKSELWVKRYKLAWEKIYLVCQIGDELPPIVSGEDLLDSDTGDDLPPIVSGEHLLDSDTGDDLPPIVSGEDLLDSDEDGDL